VLLFAQQVQKNAGDLAKNRGLFWDKELPDCTFADTRRIKAELGWSARVPIERGVEHMLSAIEYWRDAPVWTPASIAAATAEWFDYLGNRQ
jgi:nucleoside-diphosphate-sugar epimerase